MTKVLTNNKYYTEIADAIRSRNGLVTKYKPSEMAAAIQAIPSGEGFQSEYSFSAIASKDAKYYFIIRTLLFKDGERAFDIYIDDALKESIDLSDTTGNQYVEIKTETYELTTGTHTVKIVSKNGKANFISTECELKNQILAVLNYDTLTGLHASCKTYTTRSQSSSWSANDTKIYRSWTANGAIYFNNLVIPAETYSKLHCIAEVPSGTNGYYNCSFFGIRYTSLGLPSNYYGNFNKSIAFTNYSNSTNYDKSSPWYTLKKQECVLDISDAKEEFWLCAHACDCSVNIYSVWLE